MKTFHVQFLFASPNGPALETATFKAGHPSILELQIATEIYEIEYSYGWEFVSAIVTEVEMHTKVSLLALPN